MIVDHESPFLKTIVINKGSADGLKIGTNIFDRSYLIGRVIETNYKTSRILLLSDLNSSVPISITPGNIQAIAVGDGKNSGEIKYIKGDLIENIQDNSIGYTSGTGDLFRSGVPVGKLTFNQERLYINFYSDFSQLKYVFAEIEKKDNDFNTISEIDDKSNLINTTEAKKTKLLNDQIKILNDTTKKFIDTNKDLVSQIEDLRIKNNNLKETVKTQIKEIDQKKIDQKELEFLRLNLLYSSKCQKSGFRKGFKVGTPEYKKCILNKGKKINE